jgi:hypothetical protein
MGTPPMVAACRRRKREDEARSHEAVPFTEPAGYGIFGKMTGRTLSVV